MQGYGRRQSLERGYSLSEMLVVASILATMSLVAIPSFRQLHAQIAIDSLSSDLLSMLRLGRDEALTTGSATVLCPSRSGIDCSAGNWNDGWVLFVDNNNDSTGAAGSVDPSDSILRASKNRHKHSGVTVAVGLPQIRFDSRGRGESVALIFCVLGNEGVKEVSDRQTILIGRAGLFVREKKSARCEQCQWRLSLP